MESTQQTAKVISINPQVMTPAPLSVHVKAAVELYFSQLNGHDPAGLYDMVISEVEKPLLQTALEQSGFNQTKAAKTLGLSRSTLRKKLAQYNIS